MAIVDTRDLLNYAYRNGFAVAAFDVTDLVFLQSCIEAAERGNSPLILNLSSAACNEFQFDALLTAAEHVSEQSTIPVAINLKDSQSPPSVIHSINNGCNAVFLDTSSWSLADNMEFSKTISQVSHDCGVSVGGNMSLDENLKLDEMQAYVKQTEIDFLLLDIDKSINSSYDDIQNLLLEQIKSINNAVSLPLCINSLNGLDSEWYQKVSRLGVSKIDFDSENIQKSFFSEGHAAIKHSQNQVQNAMIQIFESLGSSNKAHELLYYCAPWSPVEHLIIFNVANITESETKDMMSKGKQLLSTIPGVRRVDIGDAITENAKYRYTWLVRFCHPNVIDTYREHPTHVKFADTLFRPVAGDRISIDYRIL